MDKFIEGIANFLGTTSGTLTLISSGIISVIVQYIFKRRTDKSIERLKTEFQKELKEIDYKNDYYKKIIDKRINAYDELEKFIGELDIERDNNYDNKTYHCYNFLTELDDCRAAAKRSADICGLNSWFSVKLENQVNSFNEKLVDVANEMNNKAREAKIDKKIDLQREIYQIACKYHNEIKELIFNLKAEIIKDRLKLHEVEDYLKDKQKNLKM